MDAAQKHKFSMLCYLRPIGSLLIGGLLLGASAHAGETPPLTPPPDLTAWAQEQNITSRQWLAVDGGYEAARQDILAAAVGEDRGLPVFTRRGVYFLWRKVGEEQASLYFAKNLNEKDPKRLIDPSQINADGHAAITMFRVSPDGEKIAYAVQYYGTDWAELRVRHRQRGELLAWPIDNLKLVGGGFVWDEKGNGLYYTGYDIPASEERYLAPDSLQTVYYHKLGSKKADRRIFTAPDDTIRAQPQVLSDGTLVLRLMRGTQGDMLLSCARGETPCALSSGVGDFSYHLTVAGEAEDGLLVVTDRHAPRSRLVHFDPKNPQPDKWREVLPEQDQTLVFVKRIGGALAAVRLDEGQTRLYLHDINGSLLREVPLPNFASLHDGLAATADGNTLFYKFSSHLDPPQIHNVSMTGGAAEPEVHFMPVLQPYAQEYITERMLVPAADGEFLPVFISHRKDWRADQGNFLLMEGYGGWNRNKTPEFSPLTLAWLRAGGAYATVLLRGGGEKGSDWHRAGTLKQKPMVFSDLAAISRYLIERKITSPQKFSITGISNGGLLTAANLIRNPELYGAVVIRAGALDLLTIENYTIGRYTMPPELGSASDSAARAIIASYSPYQNIRSGMKFPPVLIMTGDYDDRVVPQQSYAFARKLVDNGSSGENVHLVIVPETAHSRGFALRKYVEWWALELSFLKKALAME